MTPLLFLPGMMCDARLFAPQIAALSARYPVMVCPLTGADTVAGLALQILATAPPRFALAGLSMGGIVAMEVLRQAPDRVDRIALLDTNPRAELEEVKALRRPQMQAAARGNMIPLMQEQMFPRYFAADTDTAPLLDLCRDMADSLGPEVFRSQSLALRDRPAQIDTLRAYGGKALVLCGAEDQLCPLDRHSQMHDLLADSTLVVVNAAGHLTTLEQPQAVTDALRSWMES